MAWNFRRRKKIAPGVYINMSKKGINTTVGPKGASMTFGPNGTYLNTSIPGTGMYNRRKISSNSSKNNISFTPSSPSMPRGCSFLLTIYGIFNLFFVVELFGELSLCYDKWGVEDVIIFLVGNVAFIIFGLIFEWVRHSIQKRKSVFSYKREIRSAQKILDSLSYNDKDMRNILKAYIRCLTINEEYDKELEIIEELKKSTEQKGLDLIPIHEARAEALKVNLEKVRYNADADLSDEKKQAFKLFVDSFEILSNSDKIWFETGITSRNLIQREETKFEFGVFDYIKSEFEIPVIRIPQTSINFYIYPHFIIRSESTTNFRIYPIEKIEIEYTSLNFREEYKQHLMQPKDATLISSNFLYETKKGEPDRRHAYNPLYITYDYGKLTIPQFRFTRSMTFYVSNRDSAKNMQKAYVNYLQYCKNDTPKEENKLASNIVQMCVTNEDELYEKLNGENSENNIMENTNEEIDISRIDNPDPILQDVIKFVISEQVGSTAAIQRKFEIGYNRAGKISDQLEELGVLGPNKGQEGREVLIDTNGKLKENNTRKENVKKTKSTSKSSSSELDALVGLSSVKEEIKTLSNFIKIQQKRKEQGLKSSSVSYHCVFTGNPGTGKTTVARIVAQIYKDLGILSKGHLVETDRAGLVAEYVGQTAVKTNKIIDSALDGVLFIDEAYSLIGTGQDYGKEAIATLLKRMEDDRDRLVVILAGYSKEMQDFINTNPGLQSRFNRYIEFPDYSAEELLQIFEKNVARFDYKLEKDACMAMAKYFQNAVENKDANFGNARFVRNIFEKTLEKQANRLSTDPDLDTEELTLITKEDLPIE